MLNVKGLKKIEYFNEGFAKKHLSRIKTNLIFNNWWRGLEYFLHISFYQGRRDAVSKRVETCAMHVLSNYIKGNNPNELQTLNYQKVKEDLQKVIGKGKIGKGRDINMVISILKYASKLPEPNLTKYCIEKIKHEKLQELYLELDKIYSIGPKITSLYLRDLICLYKLEKLIKKEDFIFFQPVDTWVRQIAFKIGIIENIKEKDQNIRQKLVETCFKYNISPIKFNQGVWYMGTSSLEILLNNLDKL